MKRPRRKTDNRRKTHALKSRYRNLCTDVVETSGERGRTTKRVRREGAPSLREWALATEDGKAWLARKRRGK